MAGGQADSTLSIKNYIKKARAFNSGGINGLFPNQSVFFAATQIGKGELPLRLDNLYSGVFLI